MRTWHSRTVFAGTVALTALLVATGCPIDPPAICDLGECTALGVDATPDGTPPDGAPGPSDGAADAPTDGPIVPPGCDKTPKLDPGVVRDSCGIFVSPTGSDTAAGTMDAPVRTIVKAITLARTARKRVYVCAAAYDEKVILDVSKDGVAVHGGFVCPTIADAGASDAEDASDGAVTADARDADNDAGDADAAVVSGQPWSYVGARARIAPSTVGPVLTLQGLLSGTLIEDFEIVARDAVTAGESSIAVIVSESLGVTLRRVKIVAGNGAPGDPGAAGAGGAAPPSPPSGKTKNGNAAADQNGAGSLICTCGTDTTTGGAGGANGAVAGTDGAIGQVNGVPTPYPASPNANDHGGGGIGATTSADCASGRRGAQPPQGATGAGGEAKWTLAPSGIGPSGAGMEGAFGKTGQGGGGGGGGSRPLSDATGGGGGGACGGCGGGAGLGGKPGGSSVALASITSSIEISDASELVSSNGGNGGNGGAGQDGSPGGTGGAQAIVNGGNGCRGGDGAAGGKGGAGGGGAGGASFPIAFKGQTPMTTGTKLTPGAAGIGGNDGNGLGAGSGRGAGGAVQEKQALP